MPERPKLHYIDRTPNYSNSQLRPPKMFKRLDLMRGPELVHNKLIHKQYGIQVKFITFKIYAIYVFDFYYFAIKFVILAAI